MLEVLLILVFGTDGYRGHEAEDEGCGLHFWFCFFAFFLVC